MRDGRADVLAHHVHGVGEDLQAVDGAAAVPRIEGGVRGASAELDVEVDQRLRALRVRFGLVGGMPGQHDVDVLEHAVPQHVELPAHRLLGRRAEESDRPFQLARRRSDP